MDDPLAGCSAKVKRASLHLEALHAEIRSFAESEPKPYRFVGEVDVESSRYLVRIRIERPPPPEWSLIAGDFVQNLRAALDHLVNQLVRANGQVPDGNAFPLFDQPPPRKSSNGERQRWNRMLAGVHPCAIHYIEFCQPYKAPNAPSHHLLAALRTLSNEDKHRALLPTLSAIHNAERVLQFEVLGVRDIEDPIENGQIYAGKSLKDKDLVLEAPIKITGPNPEIELKGHFPLDVGFGIKAQVPMEALVKMCHLVATIIANARRFLGVYA